MRILKNSGDFIYMSTNLRTSGTNEFRYRQGPCDALLAFGQTRELCASREREVLWMKSSVTVKLFFRCAFSFVVFAGFSFFCLFVILCSDRLLYGRLGWIDLRRICDFWRGCRICESWLVILFSLYSMNN